MSSTLFISDLHLDAARPAVTRALADFLLKHSTCNALYILGDLFESWIGDDDDAALAQELRSLLKRFSANGPELYIMQGNRDFLLGRSFCDDTGAHLLPDPSVIDLYGTPTLLMHGDSLCTDDIPYQQFRQLVRNPLWQQDFLAKTPQERLQAALEARDASATHKGAVDMDIMDVNADQVLNRFIRHGVHRMIHGHTHRPAIHELEVNGEAAERIVLGDWYTQGSVLRVTPGTYDLAVLA